MGDDHGVLAALGRGLARRPGLIVLVWIVLTIAGYAAASGRFGEGLFARLNAGQATVSGESSDGRAILDAATTTGPTISLIEQGVRPADPAVAEPLATGRTDRLAIDGVAQVIDPLTVPGGPASPAAAALTAKDGNGFLVTVTLEPDLPKTE